MKLEQHPLNKTIPRPTQQEYEELRDSIKLMGQHQTGTLFEGKVLTGWTRYLACEELGIDFKYEQFKENGIDAAQKVLIEDLLRRNLTTGQRAACAVEFLPILATSQSEKAKKGWKVKKGETVETYSSLNEAQKIFKCGHATIQKVRWLSRHHENLFQKVKTGNLKPDTAFRIGKGMSGESVEQGEVDDKAVKKIVAHKVPDKINLPHTAEGHHRIEDLIRDMNTHGWKLQAAAFECRFYAHFYGKNGIELKKSWEKLDSCPDWRQSIVCAAREALTEVEFKKSK